MINLGIIGFGNLAQILYNTIIQSKDEIFNIFIYTNKELPLEEKSKSKINIFYGKYDNDNRIRCFLNRCDIITCNLVNFNYNLLNNVQDKVYECNYLINIIDKKQIKKKFLLKGN